MFDVNTAYSSISASTETQNNSVFERIAYDIETQGYSIHLDALPPALTKQLHAHALAMSMHKFQAAGIGRSDNYIQARSVRTDEICWINGDTDAGKQWLAWANELQRYLNRRLILGLFSFESHFSHYKPGAYYKRHVDAFKGETNRVLSLVLYLNSDWANDDGGELVLYKNELDMNGIKITPKLGTVSVFLSEEFPHEVLPTKRDRFAIAGWFRVNGSVSQRVDPPR